MDTNQSITKLYNKDFQTNLKANPKKYVAQLGYQISQDTQIVIKVNTKHTCYVTMPETNTIPSNYNLQNLQAGATAATAGSVSTLSSGTTTLGSGGTIGTLGSYG